MQGKIKIIRIVIGKHNFLDCYDNSSNHERNIGL